jgi:hypothetical protein
MSNVLWTMPYKVEDKEKEAKKETDKDKKNNKNNKNNKRGRAARSTKLGLFSYEYYSEDDSTTFTYSNCELLADVDHLKKGQIFQNIIIDYQDDDITFTYKTDKKLKYCRDCSLDAAEMVQVDTCSSGHKVVKEDITTDYTVKLGYFLYK